MKNVNQLLQQQMLLAEEHMKAKEALHLCMQELFSIHSKFGDRKNALQYSVGLRKGMEIIGYMFGEDGDK